jgi:hypothetical protein
VHVILPPIQKAYGDRLEVLSLDVDSDWGDILFDIAKTRFAVENPGVPMMVIGDKVMVGAGEIETMLPALVAGHLERGGVAWPDIPGLERLLAQPTPSAAEIAGTGVISDTVLAPPTSSPTPSPVPTATPTPTPPPTPTPTPVPRLVDRLPGGGLLWQLVAAVVAVGLVAGLGGLLARRLRR